MTEIKTLIELFDSEQINNVIAGLRFKPDKIIFVGFNEIMIDKRKKCIVNFLKKYEFKPEIRFETVGRYDYDKILEKLRYIISENQDCGIDLTGGKELLLTAAGEISASSNVPMFRLDVKNGTLFKVKNCDKISLLKKPSIKIKDFVSLYGGAVVKESLAEKWVLDDELKRDIEILWNICVSDSRLWNRQLTFLGSADKYGSIDNTLTVKADIEFLSRKNKAFFLEASLIKSFEENKLISDFSLENGIITYRYKNNNIRRILTKSGNILELYIYMLAFEIESENPGYYDDIDIGVGVDWDGVINNRDFGKADTRNEIDIMLMRDCIPVFISCKNGEVHKEALYELETVAGKFGGGFAKKFLLATDNVNSGESGAFLKQRADDMKIRIIDGIKCMSREELKKIIMERIK